MLFRLMRIMKRLQTNALYSFYIPKPKIDYYEVYMDRTLNIFVCGDRKTGKTSYIRSLCSSKPFDENYTKTEKTTIMNTIIHTTKGKCSISFWEVYDYKKIFNQFIDIVDGIIFLNSALQNDSNFITDFNKELNKTIKGIPLINIVSFDDLYKSRGWFDSSVSAKTKYNLYEPIEDLLQLLISSDTKIIAPILKRNMGCTIFVRINGLVLTGVPTYSKKNNPLLYLISYKLKQYGNVYTKIVCEKYVMAIYTQKEEAEEALKQEQKNGFLEIYSYEHIQSTCNV